MENLNDSNKPEKKISLDENGLKQILATRNWTMFISIAGFVFIGIAFIILLITLTAAGAFFPSQGSRTLLPAIIVLGINVFPLYYLYKFSVISKEAITTNGINSLSDAFDYLKKHYRFMGILLIILLAFYLISLLIIFTSGGFQGF